MNNNNIDNKKIFLIILVPIILLILLGVLFYINITKTITIKATVKYVNNNRNYIIVKDKDSKDEYILKTNNKYNKGDILLLDLYKINNNIDPKEATIKKVSIISRKVDIPTENKEVSSIEEIDTNINEKDEEVLSYFYQTNDALDDYNHDKSLGDKIKNNFITIIDFIFYDKEINGKKFNDLSTSAKLKVLKLALSIDSKINKVLPDYKETLEDKYKNVKSGIVGKYLDITSDVCTKHEDSCEEAKKSLKELKNSFSISWNYIRNISGIGLDKLKSWYEIWREA